MSGAGPGPQPSAQQVGQQTQAPALRRPSASPFMACGSHATMEAGQTRRNALAVLTQRLERS